MTLVLHNTLTRGKEPFAPIDPANVRMYACGPTVYDRPHLGNARSAVVYDVLYRLLRHTYGAKHVTYVRNITDVDDKINAAAKANGEPISALTTRVTAQYHADLDALNCLRPDIEPRATAHIGQMVALIERLIAHGHAYAVEGHVLFHVPSDPRYGCLSHRSRDEMVAGARVEVAPFKRDPADFVLWKPANPGDDPSSVFDSPWGAGRPGWHIECSAMSWTHLGETFDIHGGGADLMFPHHENEIAQSTCALPGSEFAKVWVHNGFLTVNGEKMSKSLGNFTTVRELLERGVKGEVIRYCLLATHYRKPLDFTQKALDDAKKALDKLYPIARTYFVPSARDLASAAFMAAYERETTRILEPLQDDMNTAKALSELLALARELSPGADARSLTDESAARIHAFERMCDLLGIVQEGVGEWFGIPKVVDAIKEDIVQSQITARAEAKKARNFAEADRIRDDLKAQGIVLEDKPDGTTLWRRS